MARRKQAVVDLTQQSIALAEFGAKALVAAEQLRLKKKIIEDFPLDKTERVLAADLAGLSATTIKKLSKADATFTVAETASILMPLAEAILDAEPVLRLKLLYIAKKLIDCLQANVVPETPARIKGKKPTPTGTLFQFKITLLGIKPPIWRRIQVQDCTLDKLHEHIQTSMGWTNSHLHQFEIKGKRFGDPELLNDGFEDFKCVDSTKTLLSEVLPKTGKRFAFKYEYDFGDGWIHEVLFEGHPTVYPKAKYPLCLEGQRACPPEDCGGIGGYDHFLEAIADPLHEEHESMLEWAGGYFDPAAFDAIATTKVMRKGLPDWRSMR